MRKAIAIDFDGCLCENAWPEIGVPHWSVIRAAQSAQREGAALILWTCRCGDLLKVAVAWCRCHGLIFDAINENLPERLEHYGSESRKISADEYWDDRAVHMPVLPNAPLTMEELREMGIREWCWVEIIIPSAFRKVESCYYCKFSDYTEERAFCCGWPGTIFSFDYADYGKTWIAYRRKLEETPKDQTDICAATGGACCRCNPGPCGSRRPEEGAGGV